MINCINGNKADQGPVKLCAIHDSRLDPYGFTKSICAPEKKTTFIACFTKNSASKSFWLRPFSDVEV